NLATGSANAILLMSGKTRTVLGNSLCFAALSVVLLALLTPVYGLNGAAISVASAQVLLNLLRLVQVRRLCGLLPWDAWGWKLLGIATVSLAGSLMIETSVAWLDALFGLCLPWLLALLFGLHPDDALAVKKVFRRTAVAAPEKSS